MANISIDIPNDLLITLREQPGELSHEVRFIAALHYFREKRLSLGQAARFAGLNRVEFLDILADRGIPAFDLSEEDATAIPPAKATPPRTARRTQKWTATELTQYLLDKGVIRRGCPELEALLGPARGPVDMAKVLEIGKKLKGLSQQVIDDREDRV